MLGELFQNNHHKRPNSANFAAKWFEFDPVYPIMKFMHPILCDPQAAFPLFCPK